MRAKAPGAPSVRSYVMITGAAGGLGKAFCAECARRGWNLFLTDYSLRALDPLVAGLTREFGVRVLYQPCDLTDADAREALWDHVHRLGIRFHMLINVAGLDYEGLFADRQVRELRTLLRVNIESTVETTRHALPYRDTERPLRIINVASLAAFYPMPVKAVYAASKRFLLDWSRALGVELRDTGITVTALCPAGMPTQPETIRGIAAQGWMGRATTMNVGDVAAKTVTRALRGQKVYIPGWINQTLRTLGGLLPPGWVADAIGRRWLKARRASAGQPVSSALVAEQRAEPRNGR